MGLYEMIGFQEHCVLSETLGPLLEVAEFYEAFEESDTVELFEQNLMEAESLMAPGLGSALRGYAREGEKAYKRKTNELRGSKKKIDSLFARLLSKLGFEIHKSRGVLRVLKDFSYDVKELLYHGIKAARGDAMSKKIVQDKGRSQRLRADFAALVYQMDEITLHALTIPLHTIGALTGWHIKPKVSPESQGEVENRVKSAILLLNSIQKKIKDREKKHRLRGIIERIKMIFGIKE